MSNLEICDIQKKHYEVWIELYHKYAEYYQVDIPKDNFDLTWKWLTSENYPFWGILADVDSKIVGFAHFRSLPSPLDSCEVGFLDDLFVLQEYRGKKIGYSLIEKVHQIGNDILDDDKPKLNGNNNNNESSLKPPKNYQIYKWGGRSLACRRYRN